MMQNSAEPEAKKNPRADVIVGLDRVPFSARKYHDYKLLVS